MNINSLLILLFLFLSIGIVGLILIQYGKGANTGAIFGGSASETVFGARGSMNFLSRTTALLSIIWFLLAILLGWFTMKTTTNYSSLIKEESIMESSPIPMSISPKSSDSIPDASTSE